MEFIDEIKRWLAKNNAIKNYKEHEKLNATVDKLLAELKQHPEKSYFSPEVQEQYKLIQELLDKTKEYTNGGGFSKDYNTLRDYLLHGRTNFEDYKQYKGYNDSIEAGTDFTDKINKVENILQQVKDKAHKQYGPTGIANPVDYMNKETE